MCRDISLHLSNRACYNNHLNSLLVEFLNLSLVCCEDSSDQLFIKFTQLRLSLDLLERCLDFLQCKVLLFIRLLLLLSSDRLRALQVSQHLLLVGHRKRGKQICSNLRFQ